MDISFTAERLGDGKGLLFRPSPETPKLLVHDTRDRNTNGIGGLEE